MRPGWGEGAEQFGTANVYPPERLGQGAAAYFGRTAALCRQASFRHISFRGAADFTEAAHLGRWDAEGVRFVFGLDVQTYLVCIARRLPERVWKPLPRAGPA